jgi:heterodisulfide reductase subunit A-like polyferredoxin
MLPDKRIREIRMTGGQMERGAKNNDKIGAAMVVGGGIAGIQATLDPAESGFMVIFGFALRKECGWSTPSAW